VLKSNSERNASISMVFFQKTAAMVNLARLAVE
jgi:hypothetical protein